MTNIEKKVSDVIKPIIENLGYELYDVIYEKEGKDNYLRIFIDKNEGISLNDCENVNNAINDILDEKDLIKDSYFLEVSSTGVEKRIRSNEHLERYKGSKIEVHLYKPLNKQKILIGTLKNFNADSIMLDIKNSMENGKNTSSKDNSLETDNGEIILDRKLISSMKTVYDWS